MTVPADAPPIGPRRRVVSRRAIGRAAVWSVPVVASVALAPSAAAASANNVSVTGVCNNTTAVTATNRRRFRVNAVVGSIPSGSTFTLTSDGNLDGTDNSTARILVANNTSAATIAVTGPVQTGSNFVYTITTTGAVVQGTSFEISPVITAVRTRRLTFVSTSPDLVSADNSATFTVAVGDPGPSQTCTA